MPRGNHLSPDEDTTMKPASRGWMVLALALFGSLLLIDNALGQPGFRGRQPGTFTGRPPGMPGSNIGGMPGPGMPGGGAIGGAIGGGIDGGMSVKPWHCPRCNREAGRGNIP